MPGVNDVFGQPLQLGKSCGRNVPVSAVCRRTQANTKKLPRRVERQVDTVLHDDVYRGTDDKRDERRYTEGGGVSLIFIANVMKHTRYRYPCHAEA
ncbi:hypothetical protein [Paraburkholderia panacisoli]|uniref:hypothetical protein n=1 Tax=Paraburkholderia panacisoli TaxID=2603818 RepID=UPI001FE6044B|nr:hypothetical protein [Paraburkholderia panacisoli]